MGASLLRLFFHDCFVNGCDGSLLLDDTSSFTGEKRAAPNVNSVRGFEVIDNIKSAVEKACPSVVSCADILAVTARDSVVILGGPNWNVKLGRRDARTASQGAANSSIPAPTFNLNRLISSFSAVGLSTKDMVSHTIGQARCTTFRARIYNETNSIDSSFARTRQNSCPRNSGSGLLHSDQQLFNGGSADSIVRSYINNPSSFNSDFVTAMINDGRYSSTYWI
ncbi:hypothetical protein KY290_008913 [Solanum tuberosum]|uniref:peroxidase n=1 Tax=Solanum tuberosum TaxID=4113 RepID=A0ABQ7W9S0_SOLTU|nr:hypothetical protein KY290_008913 [Solanum tuberosum]